MVSKKLVRRLVDLSLNPVPVKMGTKEPLRKAFTEKITEEELYNIDFPEIGISTGYASLNLEVLDFDLDKVEDPDSFMDSYKSLIPKELFAKLVRENTPKGGIHYIYRCSTIGSNQKLARNNKGEATIETRGIGGYIKCYPSEGYTIQEGSNSFDKVATITEGERDLLFIIAKQFDKLRTNDVKKRYSAEDLDSFKKFREYNTDPDIGIDLLLESGWTFHSENGDWYNLTRPDSKSGDLHGGYNREGLFFQCFSTAQDTFEEGRGYNNHHLYAELECDGNYRKAYRELYDKGYGVDRQEDEDEYEDELSFISTSTDEDDYLEQARKNEIPLGLTLGWKGLDENFLLKRNSFNFLLGVDNIGKSTLLSSFMVSSNILHGLKWGISSPESAVVVTRRNLIEADCGKQVVSFKDKPLAYQALLQKNRKSFFIVKNDSHSTIDEILLKGKKLYQRHGIDFLLIDPFSFYAGSGNFNNDTEVLSKIRVFCQNYCGVLVVDHPYTNFTREAKDEFGYLRMPSKYDASGGNSKPNRCDDFICAHRIINHDDPTIRRTMQISIQKVKDKSTGGQPHIDGDYFSLEWDTRDGFTGYWDSDGNNPIYEYHKSKLGVTELNALPKATPQEAF